MYLLKKIVVSCTFMFTVSLNIKNLKNGLSFVFTKFYFIKWKVLLCHQSCVPENHCLVVGTDPGFISSLFMQQALKKKNKLLYDKHCVLSVFFKRCDSSLRKSTLCIKKILLFSFSFYYILCKEEL